MATDATDNIIYDKDRADKLKFDNVYGELDFFKKKCEILEKDLFKSHTSNKKNEAIIKKLQDMIAIYGKNTNNTSNSYLLPSEFKSNWETLVKDQIMEAFENSFFDYSLLTYLVQDTIKIIYNESLEIIKEKIINVIKVLNILEGNNYSISKINKNKNNNIQSKLGKHDNKESDKSNEKDKHQDKDLDNEIKGKIPKENKSENEKNKIESNLELFENLDYEKFICKFRLIFQEYFSVIFQCNDSDFQNKIKEKLNSLIKKDDIYKSFSEEKKKFIQEDLNSKSFNEFSLSALKLCLYMHLHEPKLTFILPSSSDEERKLVFYYYKKDEFTNIEGFPKEKCCCVVILPCPILRSNYSYQGIKPAVYIIPQPTQEIYNECNLYLQNNNEKENEKGVNKESDVNNNCESYKAEDKSKGIFQDNDTHPEKEINKKITSNSSSEAQHKESDNRNVSNLDNNNNKNYIDKSSHNNNKKLSEKLKIKSIPVTETCVNKLQVQSEYQKAVPLEASKSNDVQSKEETNNNSKDIKREKENRYNKSDSKLNNNIENLNYNSNPNHTNLLLGKYNERKYSFNNEQNIKNNHELQSQSQIPAQAQVSNENFNKIKSNYITNSSNNNINFTSNLIPKNNYSNMNNKENLNNNNISNNSNNNINNNGLNNNNNSNVSHLYNNQQKQNNYSHTKNHSHVLSPIQPKNLSKMEEQAAMNNNKNTDQETLYSLMKKEKSEVTKNNYFEHPLSIARLNLQEFNNSKLQNNNANKPTNNNSNFLDSNRTAIPSHNYNYNSNPNNIGSITPTHNGFTSNINITNNYLLNNKGNNSANNFNTPIQVSSNNQSGNNANYNKINNYTGINDAQKIVDLKNEIRNYRSNSHNFHLTHSRNQSAIENLNNSFHKDNNNNSNINNSKQYESKPNNTNTAYINTQNHANNSKKGYFNFNFNSNQENNNININNIKQTSNNITGPNANNLNNKTYIKNDFYNKEEKPSNSPITRTDISQTANLNERALNLIKPFTNNTSTTNNQNNQKDHLLTSEKEPSNKEYLFPYRQDLGKTFNSLNIKAVQSNNTNSLREDIKITSIQANTNQLGKLNVMVNNSKEKEAKDRTNFPLKIKNNYEESVNNLINNNNQNTNSENDDSSMILGSNMFNRLSNNKNNNYINLEFINLTRKKNHEIENEEKILNLNATNNLKLLDSRNIPHHDSCKKDLDNDLFSKSYKNTPDIDDTLTIQQNERKMNSKKKEAYVNPSGNINSAQIANNMNSPNNINSKDDKEISSPRGFYNSNNVSNYNTYSCLNQLKQFDTGHHGQSSVLNTENSEHIMKNNNTNNNLKHQNSCSNLDFFSSATAKFYENKNNQNKNDESNINLKTNSTINNNNNITSQNPENNQGCFMYIPKRDSTNRQKDYDKPFFSNKFRESNKNSCANNNLNTDSNSIQNISCNNNANCINNNNDPNSSRQNSKINNSNINSILGNNRGTNLMRNINNSSQKPENLFNDIKYNGLKSGEFNAKLNSRGNNSNNLNKNINNSTTTNNNTANNTSQYDNSAINVKGNNYQNYNSNNTNNNNIALNEMISNPKKGSASSLLHNTTNPNTNGSITNSKNSKIEKSNTYINKPMSSSSAAISNSSPKHASGNSFLNMTDKSTSNQNNNFSSYGLSYKERMKNLKMNATNSLNSNNINNNYISGHQNQPNTNTNFFDNSQNNHSNAFNSHYSLSSGNKFLVNSNTNHNSSLPMQKRK